MNPQTVQEFGYEHEKVHARLECFARRRDSARRTFAQEISASLGSYPRSIAPKFFYDERGSELFERICALPEYYLTRTEAQILYRIGGELARLAGPGTRLVELGSGSSNKTRIILDALAPLQERLEYMPIDISDALVGSCRRLLAEYPGLHVTGVIDAYAGGLRLAGGLGGAKNLVAFLGSSLGNFERGEAGAFLSSVASSMGTDDLFLIGFDMLKDKHILERAYDDEQGVTAAFNLNVLSRINAELDGNFAKSGFAHHVMFNPEMQRIEMYLKSLKDQRVHIWDAGLDIKLARDELIHTEHSHKYTIPQISEMLGQAGLDINRIWHDDDGYYSLVLCSKIRRRI